MAPNYWRWENEENRWASGAKHQDSGPAYPFLFPIIGVTVLVAGVVAFRLITLFGVRHESTGASDTASNIQTEEPEVLPIEAFIRSGSRFPDFTEFISTGVISTVQEVRLEPTGENGYVALFLSQEPGEPAAGAVNTQTMVLVAPTYWRRLVGPFDETCSLKTVRSVAIDSSHLASAEAGGRLVTALSCASSERTYIFDIRQGKKIAILDSDSSLAPQFAPALAADGAILGQAGAINADASTLTVRIVSTKGSTEDAEVDLVSGVIRSESTSN